MLTYPLPKVLNAEALAEEISTIIGAPVLPLDIGIAGDQIVVRVPDAVDGKLVAPVVAAHTGQPTPAQQAELDAAADHAVHVGHLRDFRAAVRAGTFGNGLTAAQRRDQTEHVIADLIGAVRSLLR